MYLILERRNASEEVIHTYTFNDYYKARDKLLSFLSVCEAYVVKVCISLNPTI